MEVFNLSKNKKICNVKEAKSLFGKAIGLMFKKELKKDESLLIELSLGSSIHSFFMRFPIDLIFLDENFTVVEIANLKPWKLYTPKKKVKWVLEVNEGVIKEKDIEIGDRLGFR